MLERLWSDLSLATLSAWQGIVANRTRSGLTILGIVIGVAAVIGVVSIVQGFSSSVSSSFKFLGTNTLTIRSDTSLEDQLQGKINRLTLRDFQHLTDELGSAGRLTPFFSPFGVFGTTVRTGDRSTFSRVSAVTPSYQEAYDSYVRSGRFITNSDDESRRKVTVIGPSLRKELGLSKNPIGQFININGEWLKVIGIAEPRGDMFGIDQDNYALIPFGTGESLAGINNRQDISIMLNVGNASSIDSVQERAEQILRRSRNLKPGQPNDFKVQTAQQLADSFSRLSNTITGVAAAMVGISLLVAGIGIMNMMLISVTERTPEIGICKALGAQRHQILTQFLMEAALLAFLGGLVGVLGGWLIGITASFLLPDFPPAVVPLWSVTTALIFSTFVGVVFGVIPAAQAANLSPMEALRRE